MKTIFFGGSSFVIPIINTLKEDFGLDLVVVKNENDPLINYCKLNNINFEINGHLKYAKEESLEDDTKILSKDFDLGVVADYGVYIPEDILSFYKHGIINVHPSLLPKFRGPTPVQSALLANEKTTGVTIIKIDNQIDHGPILAQKEIEIKKSDTSFDLLKNLFELGALLIKESLPKYLNGDLIPTPQDDSKATFTRIFIKNDGFVDITKLLETKNLEQMIKALHPWPSVWTKILVAKQNEKIVKFLPHNQIQVEGKKPMSYKDFLNGYPEVDLKLKTFLLKYV